MSSKGLDAIVIVAIIALFLLVGGFFIKGGHEKHCAPTISSEELQQIKEYILHLEELNEINNKLIEQYQLRHKG